jgi:hypothetical protein
MGSNDYAESNDASYPYGIASKMSRHTYAVAHRRHDQWEAFSFDFDLAVQDRFFEEVAKRLKEAVNAYIATALEQPEPTRTKLLRRTAPLRIRFAWAVRIALWTIFLNKSADESAFGFPVPCPV